MTVAAVALGAGVADLDQFPDETGGLELVELPHPDAEAIEGQFLDDVAVEVVLGDELEDEFFLLVGTGPASVAVGGGIETVDGAIDSPVVTESVFVSGDEADRLDFTIDGVLEEVVEPRGFALHLAQVRQLGLDRDRKLVRTVAGQAEPLGVVGDEFDCHVGFPFWWVGLVPGHEKTRPNGPGCDQCLGSGWMDHLEG